MSDDLISRRETMKEFSDFVRKANDSDFAQTPTWNDAVSLVGSMPSVDPEQHGRVFKGIVVEYPSYNTYPEYKGKPYFSIKYMEDGQEFIGFGTYKPEVLSEYLKEYFMPSAESDKGEWTTEEVAEILASVLGDECACNFNGIDEWLPSACKYADTECPTPKEKHGCWIQFLMQGRADMRGPVTFD